MAAWTTNLRIGCSGWNYRSWKGRLYPASLPASRWLERYAGEFDTVEVNNSFYRLPAGATFEAWRRQTPPGFVMAVKASRYLTHLKRLRDPAAPLRLLFERAGRLGPCLGPVLYQLPPTMTCDVGRLEGFLDALPRRVGRRPIRHVVEFRNPTWYVRDVFDRLERAGVAICLHDKAGSGISDPGAGPFVYVRFHGPTGAYGGSYDEATLSNWAARLRGWRRGGRDVYAYFNNDIDGHAVENARALRRLAGARARRRTR